VIQKARDFAALHVRGNPIIIYNAWDVGSAKAIAAAGAKAIGTGSWSVAAAYGFDDGEKIPLDLVLDNASRIAGAIDIPLTLDFEGGYARGGRELESNIRRVIEAGVVGINFEDRIIDTRALYSAEEQAERVRVIRRAADAAGVPLFINARTDVFLSNDVGRHADLVGEAIERGRAYVAAGASGIFVPGIRDEDLIRRVCAGLTVPVNVIFLPELPPRDRLAAAGVGRISYGPRPYRETMARLTDAARAAIAP
jgi:2-methylisocitrate lyase-like PEP mutase family enzyme